MLTARVVQVAQIRQSDKHRDDYLMIMVQKVLTIEGLLSRKLKMIDLNKEKKMISIHSIRAKDEIILEDQPRTFLMNQNMVQNRIIEEVSTSFNEILRKTLDKKIVWNALFTDSFVNTRDYLYLVYISTSLLKFIVYGMYEDGNYKVQGKIIFLSLQKERKAISDKQTIALYDAIVSQNPALKGQDVGNRIRNKLIWNYEPIELREYREELANRLDSVLKRIRQHMYRLCVSNIEVNRRIEEMFPLCNEELICLLRKGNASYFFESSLSYRKEDGSRIIIITTDVGFGIELQISDDDISLGVFSFWYKMQKQKYNVFAIIRALFSGEDTWNCIEEWMVSHQECFSKRKIESMDKEDKQLEVFSYLCEQNELSIRRWREKERAKKTEEYNRRCDYIKEKTGKDPREPVYVDAMDFAYYGGGFSPR